ncbi:MAG TPA: cytochrome c3 family protein [Myxococcota bacterium]|nr:cytochrome c3 family protein [Myxococcota bacterium]
MGRGLLGVALVLALASAVRAEPSRAPSRAGWPEAIDRRIGDVVSPGALARAHADLEGVRSCTSCHAGLSGTPDAKCLACHEDVGERMKAKLGVHGDFTGACSTCHAEHRGEDAGLLGLDREAFNHDRARFALRGAHVEVECEKCHVRPDPETGREGFHPIGIAFDTCVACHEDPHGQDLVGERDCAACHVETSWRAPHLILGGGDAEGFRHERDTGFALAGRHESVECAACHTPERRVAERAAALAPGRGAPRECAACHEDPHESALGPDCARCHEPAAWQGPGSKFDHALHTEFRLDALHAALECGACHASEDAGFAAEGTTCSACHARAEALLAGREGGSLGLAAEPDPHHGRVECRSCHPEAMAETRLVDYGRVCAACHPPQYAALLLTRQRILDELVVRGEGELRRLELAGRRGERADDAGLAVAAQRMRDLARSGIHHPDLAEAILRAELGRLAGEASQGAR